MMKILNYKNQSKIGPKNSNKTIKKIIKLSDEKELILIIMMMIINN